MASRLPSSCAEASSENASRHRHALLLRHLNGWLRNNRSTHPDVRISAAGSLADVSAILAKEVISVVVEANDHESITGSRKSMPTGYVYLVKSGKLYKIGCSENHWRRKSDLHKQTSEGITEIHTISATDDAPGIVRYWHERLKEKRQHGEWFDLSAEDITAFKKRKFM